MLVDQLTAAQGPEKWNKAQWTEGPFISAPVLWCLLYMSFALDLMVLSTTGEALWCHPELSRCHKRSHFRAHEMAASPRLCVLTNSMPLQLQ